MGIITRRVFSLAMMKQDQELEDDFAAEEDNKLINEVCILIFLLE